LDLSRDTPSYLHSSNSLALCDTLVLGCHRVPGLDSCVTAIIIEVFRYLFLAILVAET
jgi:hypothetical protein